jgi:hypothetical protein
MSETNAFCYPFDSGIVPVPKPSWTQVLAIDTSKDSAVTFGIDIAVTGGAVNLMLSRTARRGEQHVPIASDFTKTGRHVQVAMIGNPSANFVPTGTINQPGDGDFIALNVDTTGSSEIGIYARAVSGAPSVRAYGKVAGPNDFSPTAGT